MAEQQSSSSQPPKEWQARRSRLAWRALLIFNLSLGAYIFTRPRKKETTGIANHRKASEREARHSKAGEEVLSPPIETMAIYDTPTDYDMQTTPPPAMEPVTVREPIPEDLQRELFKWMLEEKRKAKPKDSEEKKRINEDKAILKQFIRAKSIPRF